MLQLSVHNFMKQQFFFFLMLTTFFCNLQSMSLATLSPFDTYTTGMLIIFSSGFYILNHDASEQRSPVRRAFRAGAFTTMAATCVAATCAVPGIPASAVFVASFTTAQLFIRWCGAHRDFRTDNGTTQAFIHGMAVGVGPFLPLLSGG
jgi:hypothetical protein